MTTEQAIISGVIPAHTREEKDILIKHLKEELEKRKAFGKLAGETLRELETENERLKEWIERKREHLSNHDAVTLTVHELTKKERDEALAQVEGARAINAECWRKREGLEALLAQALEIIEWVAKMDSWTLATGNAVEGKARQFLKAYREKKP